MKIIMAEKLRVGVFTTNTAIIVADAKEFLQKENIRVEIDYVTDSPTLLRNLIDGKYDIILANADNVISWSEGQGADPQTNDLLIFLGGSQGVNQKLVVAPYINDFTDLRGSVFAVDAPTTGYAIVGIFILKAHGLELTRDYKFKSFGNTAARAEALSRGLASGAMMGMLDNEIEKRRFRVLARAEEYVKRYARGLGTTRRQWANANEDLLVRFSRAMIRATDWILDTNNKEEVMGILSVMSKIDANRAQPLYEEALSAQFGLLPHSRIDIEGIRAAIELRGSAGLMKSPVPKAEKYVDERFYKIALATL
jgi:ABC-type nitrate/sulfonate/bicarbonate transport system substrate-binding protein